MRLSTEEKQSLVARYHAGESVAELCADAGVARSTFYTWIKPYTTTTTDSGYSVSHQEFIKLKQKNQKLEQKVEILQRVGCTVSAPLQEKLQELASCMVSTASMRSARPSAFLAVLSTIMSSEEKK